MNLNFSPVNVHSSVCQERKIMIYELDKPMTQVGARKLLSIRITSQGNTK